ncbi:hypothetical protein [Paenibacillus thiaminolyticus]|uniref:hypothetical protein n=1 Tax=Paenibacillus thiaminolyticus TaxID=49283 RepID=UPI00160153F2|nr:hypothetical protein [Paenibacillus thiaminolyticus]
MNERKREDLIGQQGSVTRRIEIIDAKEGPFGVDIRVCDSMGDEYWTEMDEDISLY